MCVMDKYVRVNMPACALVGDRCTVTVAHPVQTKVALVLPGTMHGPIISLKRCR